MQKKSILIHNIGTIVTGDIRDPISSAKTIYIEDGLIAEIGTDKKDADIIINANSLLVTPGLIDSHVHPVFGDFTPVQNSTNWISRYLHGGITRMVSAGELHLPGLPLEKPDPVLFKYLAILSRACYKRYRPSGVKVEAGTLILAPGLKENDFDDLIKADCKNLKFIFFPYDERMDEAKKYREWATKREMIIKIHSGGVSRSGVSRPAGADVIFNIKPDIVGHINGGPIPMSRNDMIKIVESGQFYMEISYCGNFPFAKEVIEKAIDLNLLDKIILGTDTPSGTGVTPRGLLRILAYVASIPKISPEVAICMATGNSAIAHALDTGFIKEGKPADIVIMGKIQGSEGNSHLEALSLGNLLGISVIIIDGEIIVYDRSEQTPPPIKRAFIEEEKR